MAGLLTTIAVAAEPLAVPERGFISSSPGESWEEGLISGNGTIGINVLSRPLEETVIFTHERLFLPDGPPLMPPNCAPRLFEIRNLIDRGLYRQATQLAFDLSEQEGFMYPDPFVPAFDMSIQMDAKGEVTDYMRSVDFQTGETTVHWADTRGVFERRMFVSREDGIAVLQITGPEAAGVNCRMKLGPRKPTEKINEKKRESSTRRFEENIIDLKTTADESGLTFRNGFAQAYPGSIQTLEGVVHVAAPGGKITTDGDTLVVGGAKQVLALIDIKPIYEKDKSKIEATKAQLAANTMGYDELLTRHARIHGEMFNRMRLDIGGGADHGLTTEVLLARTTNEKLDKTLIEKEFDAGRYNIICATGELPPTLQGVWGGTYVPSWASDFTHNGNVPSAIASMMMGNTPELMLAYTSYIESIVPYLELNAKRIFGCRGVVLPSRSTTNGFNNSFAPRFAGAFWVAGSPWAAHFFYDYYLYTGDREFLAEHALPFMEKAALFFEDYCYEGPDGKYIFSPTQSPENTPSNSNSQGTFNATMDIAAAKELLHNVIAASKELGVNEEKIPVWEAMLEKMPPYMIGEDGAVKEWLTPKLEDRHGHRHASHLYPILDWLPKEIDESPQLRDAFKRLIDIKLDKHWQNNGSGFMSFGIVQLGQASTTLGEPEMAYRCLVHLVNRYWLSNLASMHNHKTLFNTDISGGMPAVIIKMLVDSYPGELKLLQAVPPSWPTGSIEGVLCRGQIEIKRLEWNETSAQVTLTSGKTQSVTLTMPREITTLAVEQGDVSVELIDKKNARRISLPAGQEVTLAIEMK